MERMMSVRQVAELLGVHENWVYDQAAAGVLPSYKIGGTRRFDCDELRGWIAEHRQGEWPRAQHRTAQDAKPPAGHRRAARREDSTSQPERSKRSSKRTDRQGSDLGDEPQPRLFEARAGRPGARVRWGREEEGLHRQARELVGRQAAAA